jgi:nicotinate-nucleotide adenylyltransferase
LAIDGRQSTRLGVFGGTFDPPHIGHLIIASEIRQALSLDRVLFVPAGRPPHKTSVAISDDADRMEMVRLAITDNPTFEISSVDIERGGPSFTADLLSILAHTFPSAALTFLMGEDSLRDLPTWHEPGRIVSLAELGVATRPGVDVNPGGIYEAVPEARGRVHLVPAPAVGISSRDLRRRFRSGAPTMYQLPASVERYIQDRQLYRPR